MDQGYNKYVGQLYDQWLRRESWCACYNPPPLNSRRHFPYKYFDKVSFCTGFVSADPYRVSSGIRPVYFPPPRRMFPDLKNQSSLTGVL